MPDNQQAQAVQYIGLPEHGIDGKRRCVLPQAWLPADWETKTVRLYLLVWRETEGAPFCLMAMPEERWQRFIAPIVNAPLMDAANRKRRTWISGNTEVVSVDANSRITIPQRLAERAGIGKKAVLVGQIDHFLIYDSERYTPSEGSGSDDPALSFSTHPG